VIFWHANLGRNVDRYEFERNLRAVLDAAGPRAVICFQEIDEADAPEELEIISRLTRNTHVIVGGNTAVPILVPRRVRILGDRQTLAARGLALFTPHRPINEVLLELRPDLRIVVLNTHLPIDRVQTFTRRLQVRRKLRARANARLQQLFGGVWVADTNTRRGWPTIVKGETTVINAGIDKSKAWAPPGYRVEVSERQSVDLTIDGHNAHGARVRFIKERSAA
jgi:hypothetical protein